MCAMPLSTRNSSGSSARLSAHAQAAQAKRFKPVGDIALLFGLLVLLELALPGNTRLSSINPHPLWIPVLLVSVQHGSKAGLVSAIVATVLVVLWLHPERHSTVDFYTYTTQLFTQPVLWIAAAFFLGRIRDRHLIEKRLLELQAESLKQDRQLVGEHSLDLTRRMKVLERHITTMDATSVNEALHLLAQLRAASAEQIIPRLQAAATSLLGAGSVLSIHRQQGTRILTETVASDGFETKLPARQRHYASALANTLESDPRILSFHILTDAEVLAGALFAVPLQGNTATAPIGVLSCESIDSTKFDLAEQANAILIAMEALATNLSVALRHADERNEQRRLLNHNVDAA